MPDRSALLEWRGRTVVDADDSKLGKIEEIYVDTETERGEWALVNTGMFAGKPTFMPLRDVTDEGDNVKAPYTKDQVKHAPQPDADGELSQEDEAALYAHYGIDYGESRSGSGLPEGDERETADRGPVGHDVSGPETDDAMTRSEEELRVGTASREAGRARLVKHVVTENVTQTVPVSHEEVRVEREPITDANREAAASGGEITEEEHEVILHAEEPVVDKRTVAKERVRMDKDTVTEDREVSEQVRKEQIETEGGRR